MSFTEDFQKSYKQEILNVVQISEPEITSAEIVSRMAECIKNNFPKAGGQYDKTFICKNIITKKEITDSDVDFVKESIKEPMATLNMSLSHNSDPFVLGTRQYSVFRSRGLFEKSDFNYVNCYLRVSTVDSI